MTQIENMQGLGTPAQKTPAQEAPVLGVPAEPAPAEQTPVARIEATREGSMVSGTFCMPANSSVARLLEALSQKDEPRDVEVPEPMTFGWEEPASQRFLTVVMRTQGKRLEELAECFLCLGAQTDSDFEVVLIGHNVDPQNESDLLREISWLPASMRARLRYYHLDRGGRATPLQLGFQVARGRYVTFYDDDDLLMDRWVANFRELAREHDGKILHSYVACQDWCALPAPGQAETHHVVASKSWFSSVYCHDFDAAGQLAVNACPFMGLAFPAYVFKDLGLRFDESLTTTEDWDFLMRAYPICGSVSCDEPSAVYRLWKNAESSHTLHRLSEWDDNYQRITQKMNERPYLLDAGAADDIRAKDPASSVSRVTLANTSVLALFDGNPTAKNIWKDLACYRGRQNSADVSGVHFLAIPARGAWDVEFDVDPGQDVRTLVYSPTRAGNKVMAEFVLQVTFADGTQETLDYSKMASASGSQVDCNHLVLLKDNPYVMFRFPAGTHMKHVALRFELFSGVANHYVDQITMSGIGLKAGRGVRWFKRKFLGGD